MTKFLSVPQIVNLPFDPVGAYAGQIYFNTNIHELKYYDGTSWNVFAASSGTVPPGGSSGQILAKIDNSDFNTEWIDNYADWTSVVKHRVLAGVPITKGQAVYISSSDGTNMVASLSSNSSESSSSKTLGIAAQSIAASAHGYVVTEGLLSGLNTSSANAGDPVWLGTNGNIIYGLANKPVAPAHLVYLGIVTRSNSVNGEIFVKVQNGFELEELHNVLISSVADNHILSYDVLTGLWKNQSLLDAIKEVDGAGSGIDADTLDGQHGSHYLDVSSTAQTKSGNLSVIGTTTTENLDLNETQITSKTILVNVTTPILLDSFDYALHRSVEYLVQIKQNLDYAITKMLLLHDSGTNVALTEYGYVNIGSDINYSFSTAYNGQNVELYVSCSTANITPLYFTLYRTLFDG